jgi:transcriptional regulator with XRE-family HTH domain
MFMRNRVKELRDARGWSQADLAEKIDVHWQTISRIENARSRILGKRERALSEVFGVAPDDLYVRDPMAGLRTVRVQQHVQAGAYAESNLWPDDEGYDVIVPIDETIASLKLYGTEVRGPSMNKIYPEGTVLVYSSFYETNEPIEVGKRYIVERERSDGLREATVKTLQRDGDGEYWLVPESTDPRWTAIPVNGSNGDTIRVVGRVQYSVRRE